MSQAPKLPKRPFKNLDEFIGCKRNKYNRANRTRDYPCLVCEGFGKVRDESEYDSYEGYKLANWYICSACYGTGETARHHYQAAYASEIAAWKRNYDKIKLRRNTYLRAARKLTPKERQVLDVNTKPSHRG